MKFKKGDRVVFIGKPETEVTEWLLNEQIPGTVHESRDSLVFVAWDGLDDKIRSTLEWTRFDCCRGIRNGWSVYESQLAHLYGDGVESVGDTSGLVTSIFNNL